MQSRTGRQTALDRLGRKFSRHIFVRSHLSRLDIEGKVAHEPEAVQRAFRELDAELVLKLDQDSEEPKPAQAELVKSGTGGDGEVRAAGSAANCRGDPVQSEACPISDHFDPPCITVP